MTSEPEWRTRKERIDKKLKALSPAWSIVKYHKALDSSTLQRHAVEEYPTPNGPADYALFVKGKFLGIIEGKTERYKKARSHVDKLTQSILAKAFRGELVPQDPNDEPASVLLERIREERNKRQDKSRTKKTKNHRRQRRQNQLEMDI